MKIKSIEQLERVMKYLGLAHYATSGYERIRTRTREWDTYTIGDKSCQRHSSAYKLFSRNINPAESIRAIQPVNAEYLQKELAEKVRQKAWDDVLEDKYRELGLLEEEEASTTPDAEVSAETVAAAMRQRYHLNREIQELDGKTVYLQSRDESAIHMYVMGTAAVSSQTVTLRLAFKDSSDVYNWIRVPWKHIIGTEPALTPGVDAVVYVSTVPRVRSDRF